MAEVLGVFDAATKSVDGQMTLAANTVPWAANDPVEEPHYYQQVIGGDITYVGQTTPRPSLTQTAGVQYEGNVGPGMYGWTISNAAPATNYLGNGGTHTPPHSAYAVTGIWERTTGDACRGTGLCSRCIATRMAAETGIRATTCLNWTAVQGSTWSRISRGEYAADESAGNELPVQSAGVYGGDDQCRNNQCDDVECATERGSTAGAVGSGSGHSAGRCPILVRRQGRHGICGKMGRGRL